MQEPIITLTTDFGADSPYAAAMKGVILSINPGARIVDLTHAIPPHDIWHAAFYLAEGIPFFPPELVHVVVVDPGVGTQRPIIYAEVGSHRILAPDNGVISLLAMKLVVANARFVTEPRFWRSKVSNTFHGRDILAPVAAHLTMGLDPAQLGPATAAWVRLPISTAEQRGNTLCGAVLFVDHFGNLLTNLPPDKLPDGKLCLRLRGGNGGAMLERPVRVVRAYGDAPKGELVALVSSGGWWEFAIVEGNAAQALGVRRGDPVEVVIAGQS